jgi:hypothetical protein
MRPLTSPRPCCYASVQADPDAIYCAECGSPLVRCMAFQECRGLVGDDGLCSQCVDARLVIVPGATMKAPIGGQVAVPFNFLNASKIDRPLFVTGLWSRERGEWRQERLGWEKLDPGARASASVTACEIEAAGLHEIVLMWSIATRWKMREENFVFSTRVLLTIGDDSDKSGSTIQISSENQMNGNIIQIHEREQRPGEDGKVIDAIDMKLDRLDKEERDLGLRGMAEGERTTCGTVFEFKGFPPGEVPQAGLPIVTPQAMLVFGRADTRRSGGESDVQLLVQGEDGALDEQASQSISRRHFELYVQNDRLLLHVSGGNGLLVNGALHEQDESVLLGDGDVIAPLTERPDELGIRVDFRREGKRISKVTLTREPASREIAA